MEKHPFKVHRVINKLTQRQVAELLGVNRATYASWEKYETYPNASQLIRLSEIYKCSLDAFYFPDNAS